MKYTYQIEAVGNIVRADTYAYAESNSLRGAIEKLSAMAESNSDDIDPKPFRKEFRIPTMVKVGMNFVKTMSDFEEIESRYAIFRYVAGNPLPTVRTAP